MPRAGLAFYNDLRPALGDREVPRGWHSAADPHTFRSIHLTEDLVRTKRADFPHAGTLLTRRQAEDAVDVLADVHRIYAGQSHPNMHSYLEFWARALALGNIGKAVRAIQADEWCPPELRAAGDNLWNACIRSIEQHHHLAHTLLHNDPHVGNWYITEGGRMGLLDWQAACFGHWSRDVAYALPAILTIERRREWERDLLELYIARAEAPETLSAAWLLYRQQLTGGLLFWAPTLRPPPWLPRNAAPRPRHRNPQASDHCDG